MLQQSISEVKGVGPKLATNLNELGLFTVEDLLFYFPHRYDSYEIKPLTELENNEKATIEGQVVSDPVLSFFGRKKSRLTFTLQVEQFAVKAVMFNRAFAKKQLNPGDTVTVTGKWGPAAAADYSQPVQKRRVERTGTDPAGLYAERRSQLNDTQESDPYSS